jgi:hypothetical protein
MINKEFYVIIEKATGIEWARSEDIKEIKEIYNNINKDKEVFKNFKKEDFMLENNRGVIIYE